MPQTARELLTYNNDIGYKPDGALYNWYSITDSRNACPTGWHAPSENEYITLSDSLGGDLVSGGKLKEAGYSHWQSPNTVATNESGFTAYPTFFRYYASYGGNFSTNTDAPFWNTDGGTTDGGVAEVQCNSAVFVHQPNGANKSYGFPVRCIKD